MPVISARAVTFPRPHSEAIAAEEMIPLATLVRLTRPPSDRVETFMMNRSGWCAFWSQPISRAFWHCSMHWAGISRSKLRCRELIPRNLRRSQSLEEKFRQYAAKDFGDDLAAGGRVTDAVRAPSSKQGQIYRIVPDFDIELDRSILSSDRQDATVSLAESARSLR